MKGVIMSISPINFTGTIYFPNQKRGYNTDHIVKFQSGTNERTQVNFSNGETEQLPVLISDFITAYTKANRSKNEFIEIKTTAKVSI